MKTDELIDALARDHRVDAAPSRTLLAGLLLAAGVALMLFLWMAGAREDLSTVMTDARFLFKLVVNGCLLVAAAGWSLRLASPGARPGLWAAALALVPALLLLAVVLELTALPAHEWTAAAVGTNGRWCLTVIPLLGVAPLAAGLLAMKRAAPVRPALVGAALGMLAGGMGGLLYALHCTDDSPLFVVIWYGAATAILTLAGALAGSRLLRW